MLVKLFKSSLLVGTLSFAACGGVCGDGAIDDPNKDDVTEVCDDGNAVPNDGCNAICSLIETGFECPVAGQACTEIPDEVCSGGIDEDQDGLIDCADPNCANDIACVVCGDGSVDGAEICDDGNATAGDGCNADCSAVEPGFACDIPGDPCINLQAVCDAAVAAIVGDNAGDTTGGTNLFLGPEDPALTDCPFAGVGGGAEDLFSFTPAANGNLVLTLVSVTDMGIYVRTTCADDTTAIGCADEAFPDDPNGNTTTENTTVAVTGGVPLTIFVDAFAPGVDEGPYTMTIAVQ